MADIFTKEKRSELMSNIGISETDIEVLLWNIVDSMNLNLSYWKNPKSITGKPDVYFPNIKVAVFADGDFWHGKNYEEIKDDLTDFWREKIGKNMERDKRQTRELEERGFTVVRFWGSVIKKKPKKVHDEISVTLNGLLSDEFESTGAEESVACSISTHLIDE